MVRNFKRDHTFLLKKSSFTLIEVLLVLLILSVISALVVPNFSRGYGKIQMKNNVYDLAVLMRYAQSLSITQAAIFRLEIDLQNNKFWIEKKDKESEDFRIYSGRLGGKYSLLPDLNIEQDKEEIYFYPDGKIDKAYIILCRNDSCYTLSTKEQRGFVHIFEGKL